MPTRSGAFRRCCLVTLPLVLSLFCGGVVASAQQRRTAVSIVGDQFHINGVPTYQGRTWTTATGEQHRIEGLLMNARLVQGIFDDLNPQTRGQWAYRDTGRWDPDRNTTEFVEAMAGWRAHGLLAFTLNLQGGCPYGYCRSQPWDSSAFASDGTLREPFMSRLERILNRADDLGMAVVLGYFYFGQDERLVDEAAVTRAVDEATNWVLSRGYTNVIVEVNNECNVSYDHAVLRCDRVHELIERVRRVRVGGRSLYASTSLGGGAVPPPAIVSASDFVLLHGNGVREPARMVEMVREVRAMNAYTPKPIVNNEDDQPWRVQAQGWGEAGNNFAAAVANYASWGFFDFRLETEDGAYNEGYQSVPINWQVSSPRKRAFFDRLAAISGSPGAPHVSVDWSRTVGQLAVRIEPVDQLRTLPRLVRAEVRINGEVAATARAQPLAFTLDRLPQGEHFVRVRVVYEGDQGEVVIESPEVRNPWWNYGGPARP